YPAQHLDGGLPRQPLEPLGLVATAIRQPDEDASPILWIPLACNPASLLHPIDQTRGRADARIETLGEGADIAGAVVQEMLERDALWHRDRATAHLLLLERREDPADRHQLLDEIIDSKRSTHGFLAVIL